MIMIAFLTRKGIRNSQARVSCTICSYALYVAFPSPSFPPPPCCQREQHHHSKQHPCVIHQMRENVQCSLQGSRWEESLTPIAECFQEHRTSLLKKRSCIFIKEKHCFLSLSCSVENDEIKKIKDRACMWGGTDERDGCSHLLEQTQK